jgi:general secretion pathway protein D
VVNLRRSVGTCVAAGLACGLLMGCDLTSLGGYKGPQHLPDPFDTVQNTNLDPRFPEQVAQPGIPQHPVAGASYYGHEETMAAAPAQASDSGEGYELNFENTAVTTVAKVVLGDILKVGYTIDPRVQGTVTISSGRSVPKRDLIPVLENALRMSNVVLVADGAHGYRLIPSGDAAGSAPATAAGADQEGGFGISVVPLRYTSAQNILKLLDSFAIKAGMARADVGHNLILVEGNGPDRKAAVETILSFDVDWMRGQSVGIYPLENAAPEEMIKELDKIMENGDGGLNQTLVTLQPVARLNAVLVVARKPNLLKQAAIWIKRLDRANNAGASVHVYRLRYGDARSIAKVLGDLFGARQGQGLESAVNQIAPGSGTTTASSGIFGGQQNGAAAAPALTGSGGPPAASGGGGGAGIQLGNMGSGFGNSQGLVSGSGSSAVGAGAFGSESAKGPTSIVLPGIRIAADVTNNSLVIYASQENYRLIEQTLTRLDRPQLQVAIHATIAQVTLNNDLQYGVEYFLQSSNPQGSLGFNTQASGTSAASSSSSGVVISPQTLGAILPGGNFLLGSQANPSVVINALRAITAVKVLSSPSVVVLDNQEATLLVGDQVPVETGSANVLAATSNSSTTVVNSINYINTGVILRVLPRVNINGNVTLDVEQEVSGVVGSGTAPNLTPTVSQQQIKSAIAIASGQTVLLGGLITEQQSRTRNGIPVLEELPGVGDLFATNDRSTQRTELIVFIQPQIIRNSVDAAKVAEELRAKLRGAADNAFPPGPTLFRDPQFVR